MALKKTDPITERESNYNDFRKHKDEIRDAANDAKTSIAKAAELATTALASAAADAAKVRSVKGLDDHDDLIELKVLMQGLKEDIRDLKNGTSTKIDDHETRIKVLELKTSNYTITMVLYSLAVVAMISLIVYHILQK